MGFVNDFDSLARVLTEAEPITYNGSWHIIKEGLVEAGEISEEAGVVQKVMSITKSASATETAGETLSALCAMDVSESTVAGVTTTTLTPKAAIAFTPKTVALSAIAGAIGLDFGFRIGQNLVNLYFGEEWDWRAPGIYDAAKDAIRTFINADGTTYYDEETINAFSNRLDEVGAFDIGGVIIEPTINYDNYVTYEKVDPLLKITNNNFKIKFQKIITHYNLDFTNKIVILNNYRDSTYEINILDDVAIKFELYRNVDTNKVGSGIKFRVLNGVKHDKYVFHGGNEYEHFDYVKPNKPYVFQYNYDSGQYLWTNLGESSGGIDGVTKQDGATVPSNFPLDIPQTYPTWQPNPIPKPDESAITYPVEMPDTNPSSDKATKPQVEAQKGVNQDPNNDPVIENAIESVPETVPDIQTPQEPTIDDGDTPTPVIPAIGVQATGFVALYNPTQSQLSAFSQYLWSNDFLENFKKLFSNPMDAIIGLHLIYATPSRGNQAEIVCGYSHSGVMSNTVNSQYIEINCGSIKVNRYFGNVLDYTPYTKLQAYLPFVGIVDLDTNEIMNGTLNIKYRIDVLTGSCLARLKITRGDYKAELYNFAGNCAVQLPISGGSYSGIIANAIGVAGSLGATIATGGAMAPVLVGSVVSSAVNSRTNVSHSGSLGSNAGALGIMKPYLIITRPKPAEANNFNEFYGRPSNKTVRLSSCSGYTRVKEVHVDNIVATDNELSEIEQLLKEGVII